MEQQAIVDGKERISCIAIYRVEQWTVTSLQDLFNATYQPLNLSKERVSHRVNVTLFWSERTQLLNLGRKTETENGRYASKRG